MIILDPEIDETNFVFNKLSFYRNPKDLNKWILSAKNRKFYVDKIVTELPFDSSKFKITKNHPYGVYYVSTKTFVTIKNNIANVCYCSFDNKIKYEFIYKAIVPCHDLVTPSDLINYCSMSFSRINLKWSLTYYPYYDGILCAVFHFKNKEDCAQFSLIIGDCKC